MWYLNLQTTLWCTWSGKCFQVNKNPYDIFTLNTSLLWQFYLFINVKKTCKKNMDDIINPIYKELLQLTLEGVFIDHASLSNFSMSCTDLESFWTTKLTSLDPKVTWGRLEIDLLLMKWLGLTWLKYNQLVTCDLKSTWTDNIHIGT